jgi:hypothetical protein
VGSKINSGPTINKVKVVTLAQYVRRRQETFCRVNPGQLRALLLEYDDEMRTEDALEEAEGCGPLVVTHGSLDDAVYEKPFLLLDVRDEGDSTPTLGVIAHTRPFPHAHLHQDKYSPELRRYKNLEGTLIVLYDEDERAGLATSMAAQLVERGWENVFVLTGGFAAFAEICPKYLEGGRAEQQRKEKRKKEAEQMGSLVSGLSALSLDKLPSGTSTTSTSTSTSSGRGRGYGPKSSVNRGRYGQGNSETGSLSSLSSWRGRKMESVSARSLAPTATTLSTASVAESVIERARAKKGTF